MFEWTQVIKADLDNVDAEGNARKPIAAGTYKAKLSNVKMDVKKSGAAGVTFTLTIEGGSEDGRQLKEFVCLKSKDGNPLGFGFSKLKRRMLNYGLSAEQITTFKYPKKETEIGDFKLLLDTEVVVTTSQRVLDESAGDAAGVTVAEVKSVARPPKAA